MKTPWLLLASLGLGLALVSVVIGPMLKPAAEEQSLGKVTSFVGEVLIRQPQEQVFRKVELNEDLWSGTLIQTTEQAQASLDFLDKLLVAPQSRIRLEKVGPRFRVYVLSGEVTTVSPPPSKVEILNTAPAKTPTPEGEESQETTSPPVEAESVQKGQGQAAWLNETLRLHRRFLEKCFIQHMERHQQVASDGYVRLRFEVSTSGKISGVKELENTYKDRQLGQCVREVIQRMRIKRSLDRPQTVEVPIRFATPSLSTDEASAQ